MNHHGLRTVGLAGAAFVLAVAGAACSSNTPSTPAPVIATPTPVVTPAEDTTAPTDTPEANPTLLPTLPPTPTPGPSKSAPAPNPTVAPSAGPTSPAAFCTGGDAEFVKSAHTLKFDVYCAVIGKGWSLASWNWSATKSGGQVIATYKGPGTQSIDVSEGQFTAYPNTGNIGAGKFGGLTGNLDTTADGFAIYAAVGTVHYQIVGHNVLQATLVNVGKSLRIVPKT